MEKINLELWVSAITALTVFFLGILQWRSSSHVQKADAVQKIGNAYDSLLDHLTSRITELENRVAVLEKDLHHYTNWSARLVRQLVENGLVPVDPESEPKIKAVG